MRKTTGVYSSKNERLNKAKEAFQPLKSNPSASAIFSDIDGTISRVASTPGEATVSEAAKNLLTGLKKSFALVCLVTGRDVGHARSMVEIEGLTYIGSHGLEVCEDGVCEYTPGAAPYLTSIPMIAATLAENLAGDGILVEEKRLAIGIHYRLSKDQEGARARILKEIKNLPEKEGLKVMPARQAIELRPDIPVDKGSAMRNLLARRRYDAVAYFGDDTTDLAAFSALDEAKEVSTYAVKVGVSSKEAPTELLERADVVVEGVDEVLELFSWLQKAE